MYVNVMLIYVNIMLIYVNIMLIYVNVIQIYVNVMLIYVNDYSRYSEYWKNKTKLHPTKTNEEVVIALTQPPPPLPVGVIRIKL